MTASVQGLTTIRAFSAENLLINEFDELQNRHNAAWFLFIASSRCFAFWLDTICILFIAVATFSLISLNKGKSTEVSIKIYRRSGLGQIDSQLNEGLK